MNTTHGSARLEFRDDEPWLVLVGDIEYGVADRISDAELDEYKTDAVLHVDAARVTFIDSIGVSLLLRLRHHAPVVTVHAASAPVVRTLQLTGVDQLFTMLPAAPA